MTLRPNLGHTIQPSSYNCKFFLGIPTISPLFRNYKRQIEEAEEIAALNLAKFRKAQGDADEADERATLTEQAAAKLKSAARAGL